MKEKINLFFDELVKKYTKQQEETNTEFEKKHIAIFIDKLNFCKEFLLKLYPRFEKGIEEEGENPEKFKEFHQLSRDMFNNLLDVVEEDILNTHKPLEITSLEEINIEYVSLEKLKFKK